MIFEYPLALKKMGTNQDMIVHAALIVRGTDINDFKYPWD